MNATNELPVKSKALRERFGLGHTKWSQIRATIGRPGLMMFESEVIGVLKAMEHDGTRKPKYCGNKRK